MTEFEIGGHAAQRRRANAVGLRRGRQPGRAYETLKATAVR
jgi:hypothetical protein